MKKFAFLIHPRVSARHDMAKVFWPLKIVPENLLRWGIKYLPPIPRGRVRCPINGNEIAGWMIVVPLTGPQFFSLPRRIVLKKIIQAVEKAGDLGVETIGLGELTSSITRGGKDLIGETRANITNGSALTAGVTFQAVKNACWELRGIALAEQKVAVVGATGSVGTAVSFLVAEEGSSLTVLARRKPKLEQLKKEIAFRFPSCQITTAQDLDIIREADVVIVVTSGTNQIVHAEHLRQNALVYDITQPRNTSASVLKERSDITIIDGGVIATPNFDYGMDIGLGPGLAYACLTETMLLAIEGDDENYVGDATPEQAKRMLSLLDKHRQFFQIAPFQSFGNSLQKSLKFT